MSSTPSIRGSVVAIVAVVSFVQSERANAAASVTGLVRGGQDVKLGQGVKVATIAAGARGDISITNADYRGEFRTIDLPVGDYTLVACYCGKEYVAIRKKVTVEQAAQFEEFVLPRRRDTDKAELFGTVERRSKAVAGIGVAILAEGICEVGNVNTSNDGSFSFRTISRDQEYQFVLNDPQSKDQIRAESFWLTRSVTSGIRVLIDPGFKNANVYIPTRSGLPSGRADTQVDVVGEGSVGGALRRLVRGILQGLRRPELPSFSEE